MCRGFIIQYVANCFDKEAYINQKNFAQDNGKKMQESKFVVAVYYFID